MVVHTVRIYRVDDLAGNLEQMLVIIVNLLQSHRIMFFPFESHFQFRYSFPTAVYTLHRQFYRNQLPKLSALLYKKKAAKTNDFAAFLVDLGGFEPLSSRMRTERSPN